jgi:hypothetical protein
VTPPSSFHGHVFQTLARVHPKVDAVVESARRLTLFWENRKAFIAGRLLRLRPA